ncbi:MAG: DUF5107 domain-containing protein, partial [Clostridia bacterium]|nr:DUF5107 domain-containing protein [Clostridia bacterium]
TEEISQFAKKAENLIDVANDYIKAGFSDDAVYTLAFFGGKHPLIEYYKAFCLNDTSYIANAEAIETGYCFPSRLNDIAVLKYAIENDKTAANACYYLGSLYYDRFRYDDAADIWNEGLRRNAGHGKIWRNLALYYFDKAGQPEKAKDCLEKAMRYKSDPRLLLEYEQLLKNMNYTPQERLAVYDKYPKLLAERDDCYLDKLTLISQTGDFKTAISLAKAKRFHIYEGGEGKLTKQHAWMHVLYGNELAAAGDYDSAEKVYFDGVNMPKSYGEAKTFFNQEAHIFYCLGELYEKENEAEKAQNAYREAAVYKAAVSEISLFRALALKKLGDDAEAEKVLGEMLAVADNFIVNKDLRTYYGVGSPSPMPFEYDIEKNNLTDGYILKAFALLGFGKKDEANKAIDEARKLNPYDFRIFAFDRVK